MKSTFFATPLKLACFAFVLLIISQDIFSQNTYIYNRYRKVYLCARGNDFETKVSWFNQVKWVIEPVEGEYFRIRKAGSKFVIHVENDPVTCSDVPKGYWTSHWRKVPVSGTPYFRLQNRYRTEQFLHMEQMPLKSSNVPTGYWTSHWEFKKVPVDNCPGETAELDFIAQSPRNMAVITHQNTTNFGNYNIKYGLEGSSPQSRLIKETQNNKNAFILVDLQEDKKYRVDLSKNCKNNTWSGYYIGWNFHTGTNSGAPACSPPTKATEDFFCGLTSTSAHVYWQFVNGVPFNDWETYLVRYRKVGSHNWVTVRSMYPNKSIQNLSPYTHYEYQVSAKCSSGQRTAYSKSFKFTTLPIL